MSPSSHRARKANTAPNYPMLAGVVFLFVTLALYWVEFPDTRKVLVVVYVTTCMLGLLLGLGIGNQRQLPDRMSGMLDSRWMLAACFALALTTTVNLSVYYASVAEALSFVSEPGSAYERVKFMARNDETYVGLLNGSFGPLLTWLSFTKYVVFGWSVMYWRQLPVWLRRVSMGCMLYYAVQSVLIGAMVNVGTVLLSTITILLISVDRASRFRRRRLYWGSVLAGGVGFVSLSYFLGSREVGVSGLIDRVGAGLDGLVFYVSHGYVGLGYALEQPFVFTWGKTALYGFMRVFTGGLSPESYLARSEDATGWSALQVWSTAAPWLASDLTFWGVPFVLLLVGVWGGRLWNECRMTRDPFAALLLGQLTLGVFFFPANNFLFQTFANATGFLTIVFLYAMRRRFAGSVKDSERF